MYSENASPEPLRNLARQIEEKGQWRGLLSTQEHQLFVVALNHPNLETWSRFLAGKLPLKLQMEDDKTECEVDAVTLAFRVRFMLWEWLIDNPDTQVNHETEPAQITEKNGSDDDYDEEFDEEEELEPPLTEISASYDGSSDPNSRSAAIKFGSRMYNIFEDDLEVVGENGLTEAAKYFNDTIKSEGAQLGDAKTNGSASLATAVKPPINGAGDTMISQTLRGLAKTAQFGSANLCLKNLLTTIEQKRDELDVTDFELRNLISDVRKNRSKWASEERVGQEELYEACEKVVMDLRNTPESAAPFLNKVSKREAPNYYDVIKEPMDLSTVLRKLRAFQYGSKSEFVHDLNLIWTNCLTYNSDPAHFLRKHAIAMRNKTEALAPLIPDITIRSRAEVEAEAEIMERRWNEQKRKREAEAEDDPEKKRQDTGDQEHTENAGSVMQEVQKDMDVSMPNQDIGERDEEEDEENAPEEEAETGEASDNDMVVSEKEEATDEVNGDAKTESKEGEEEDDKNSVLSIPDLESTMWASATREKRSEYIGARKALFYQDRLQMDAPLSVRNAAKMLKFEQVLASDRKKEPAKKTRPSPFTSMGSSSNEPFLLEYEVNSGIPADLPGDPSPWLNAPVPRAQDLPPSRYLARGELNSLINRNLNEMQMIRRIISKILYIRDLQSGQIQSGQASAEPETYGNISDPEEDISSRLPGRNPIDSQAAQSSMRRTIAKIFMQAGFEAANPRALDCVTSIAGDYLNKLGRTLVAYLEAPNSTGSFSSVLSGSLQAMGISKPSQLTKYISDDVLKQGRRLALFRSRLNTTLVDILRPEVERYNDEQFQENSDQFVLGQFSNELGEDFFGFKDLGLDKELSVASIAVPFHLLRQRVAGETGAANGTAANSHGGKYSFPKYEPLTVAQIRAAPVLFRGALQRLVDRSLGLPCLRAVDDAALSRITHEGIPDAHAEVVAPMSEVNDKPQETKQAKEVAKQLALKREQGATQEELTAEEDAIRQDWLNRMFAQAETARQKLPANSKIVVRKRRFDLAYVLVKTEKKFQEFEPEPEPAAAGEESEGDISDNMIDFGLNGDADSSRFEKDDDDSKEEIGSLAFDDDPQNGFTFEDNLPTGSLMIQGNDDEDDDEQDDNDMSLI